MIPVSIVIVTKDEERNIEEALRSAEGFQEIIVLDSFSSDRTVEICRRYTGRVYQQAWQGYARQKQSAVDRAQGPWVFVLDADERITDELRGRIRDAVAGGSPHAGEQEYSGYAVPRRNFFLGKWIRHSGWWPDMTLRLFRKDRARFEDREVHEKVIVDGRVGQLTGPLEHYTYRSVSDYVRKMEVYSSLAAAEIRKKGRPGAVSLLVKPCYTFFKMYVLRLGFLDGMHGLILAVLYSQYTFLKYAKAWERHER